MKKIFTTILFLLFSLGNIHSQLNNFNLSDYKLPDMERRALETNFNLNGQSFSYMNPDSNTSGSYKFGNNDYYVNVQIYYNYYLNNPNFQRESNFRLSLTPRYYNNTEDGNINYSSFDFTPYISYQLENRKYYKPKTFYEINVDLSYQYGMRDRYSKNISSGVIDKGDVQTHTVSAIFPIKWGTGRIEQVQDARQAVYIFDELSKIDRMSDQKSSKEIIEFAELISQLKNKRFFDTRLRRIAELQAIDSFMMDKNYLTKSDARYFTTLADFWDYGRGQIRSTGTRISGAIYPGYYFYNYNNPGEVHFFNEGKYNIGAFLVNGGLECKVEKPINLLWQNSINFNCYLGIIEGTLDDKLNSTKTTIRIPKIQAGYYQTFGFYPNTRTSMSFAYGLSYAQLFDKTDFVKGIKGLEGKGFSVSTALNIDYYFSPELRLNIRSNLNFIWQESKNKTNIYFNDISGRNYLYYNFTENSGVEFRKRDTRFNLSIGILYSIF